MAKRSEINIFHFSFLDILFNTIGAITFMFMIFALMTNDLVEEKNQARVELEEQLKQIESKREELQEIENQSEDLKEELEKIEKEIKESKEQLKSARTNIRKQKIQLKKKDKTISQLKKKMSSMKSGQGVDSEIDPALMAEWGEAGGSEATKIVGQVIGGNIESTIISINKDKFSIPDLNINSPEQLERFLRYFDSANSKIQLLQESNDISEASQLMSQMINSAETQSAEFIKISKDSNYPVSMQSKEIRKDSNNDGNPEEIYTDLDGNGVPDRKDVDFDSDGTIDEAYFNYNSNTKTWKTRLVDINKDGKYDTAFIDTEPGNDLYEVRMKNFNPATGKGSEKLIDKDFDGVYDQKFIDVDPQDDDWEEIYTSFDSTIKKWAEVSKDTNNDGYPDVLLSDTDLTNDKYEEKIVDADYDGTYDNKWQDLEPDDSDWEAEYSNQDAASGNWKEVHFDTTGDGKWDVHGINTDITSENFEVIMRDADSDGKYEIKMEDADGDSVYEKQFIDGDGDGKYEKEYIWDSSIEDYVEKAES